VSVVDEYLERMDGQREGIFRSISGVPPERLWQRPHPKKWCAGEHLDHTRVLNRCFRLLLSGLWPVLLPFAWLARERPAPVDIDDVYQRPDMPTRVGVLWPPRYRPHRPASLDVLYEGLAREHGNIARFFHGKEEHLLGNAVVWDPAIGRLNLIQGLRVLLHHDRHHYTAVERMLLS
jgi:hypothetical protein